MAGLFKNPKFLIGFLFVFLLFIASLLYGFVFNDRIPTVDYFYNEEGEYVKPVLSPLEYPPFGTNTHGEIMLYVILVGAKYTIALTLIITAIRFFISAVIGVFLETYFPKALRLFSTASDSLQYFPITLLSYFLLHWVLFSDRLMDETFTYSFTERIVIEVIVLVIVAIPITTQLIANETRSIYDKPFIEGARLLGGSKWHILKRHVRPYLVPQFFIIFATEMIQVFLILAHLGVLEIFLGGGKQEQNLFPGPKIDVVSFSREWSGLIGANFNYLYFDYQWVPFIPIICFAVTIMAVKLSIEGMKEVFFEAPKGKKGGIQSDDAAVASDESGDEDFTLVDKKSVNS